MASPRKRTRRPSIMPAAQPVTATAASAPVAATPRAVARAEKINWSEEYSYVIRDVRYLLILSAILFAALLVIGYFI